MTIFKNNTPDDQPEPTPPGQNSPVPIVEPPDKPSTPPDTPVDEPEPTGPIANNQHDFTHRPALQ